MSSPGSYDDEVDLESGEHVKIRAIRPDDKERLLGLFHMLSPRSVYSRFLFRKKDITARELAFFTEVDFRSHVALVATLGEDDGETIIGVGRYIVSEENGGSDRAEIAIAVADEHQGHGIGMELLKHLAIIAEEAGLGRFEAIVHSGNAPMLRLFEHSGFTVEEEPDLARVRVMLHLGASQAGSGQ